MAHGQREHPAPLNRDRRVFSVIDPERHQPDDRLDVRGKIPLITDFLGPLVPGDRDGPIVEPELFATERLECDDLSSDDGHSAGFTTALHS
jgi:hypothetical protein